MPAGKGLAQRSISQLWTSLNTRAGRGWPRRRSQLTPSHWQDSPKRAKEAEGQEGEKKVENEDAPKEGEKQKPSPPEGEKEKNSDPAGVPDSREVKPEGKEKAAMEEIRDHKER